MPRTPGRIGGRENGGFTDRGDTALSDLRASLLFRASVYRS